MSGDFIVEEVEGDGGQLFRRLIFLSNQGVVQSEARLKLCMYFFNFQKNACKQSFKTYSLTICLWYQWNSVGPST
jgi:hypothetical protein